MKIPEWALPVLLGALLASQAWVVNSIVEIKVALGALQVTHKIETAKNP